MIEYVTGTLGGGKTLYAVRRMADALLQGRAVATNVALVDGWHLVLARHNPYWWVSGRSRRRAIENDLLYRYAYIERVPDLLRANCRGRGEYRGLKVIDEAHNELNNRNWQEVDQRDALKKLTMSRHGGWRVLIVSQHADNTDAGARRVATVETRCSNLRQLLFVPGLRDVSLLPFTLCLASSYPLNQQTGAVRADKRLRRMFYRPNWCARIYDTFEDHKGVLSDPNAPTLPLDPRSAQMYATPATARATRDRARRVADKAARGAA